MSLSLTTFERRDKLWDYSSCPTQKKTSPPHVLTKTLKKLDARVKIKLCLKEYTTISVSKHLHV